jgi:hypothetical protein
MIHLPAFAAQGLRKMPHSGKFEDAFDFVGAGSPLAGFHEKHAVGVAIPGRQRRVLERELVSKDEDGAAHFLKKKKPVW